MRFERLQIVLFRSSSSSFFLLRGSLPLLARSLDSKFLAKSVRTRTQVLETRVPRGFHVEFLSMLAVS